MNEITASQPVSAQTLEHVLGTGDLSKLTTQQRVEYYAKTCESLGLNPLTRPMRFLSLNGQIQLYFTRDGTDQLRKAQGITLHVVDKVIEAGLFTVTVRARAKDGREDEDIGAVVLPSSGESRANALMKAMTKAKRRVTLSICGLGQTDESELDTMPGARVFDAEDDLPVAPIREQMNRDVPLKAAAADIKRADKIADKAKVYDTETDEEKWLRNLATKLAMTQSQAEVVAIADLKSVKNAVAATDLPEVQRRVTELLHDAYKRFAEPEDEALEDVEIVGADKIAAGD